MKWSYGVMTVPTRRHSYLPKTLVSLYAAGFTEPRLFVDGSVDLSELPKHLGITVRYGEPVRTAGNWVLTLWELYARQPSADRYAVFQDDFVTYRNLRQYLEATPYPKSGYLNLYTFNSNAEIIPRGVGGSHKVGWYESREVNPHDPGQFRYQTGRGAVALIFNNDAVMDLLKANHLVGRFKSAKRGHKAVDGGIVYAMNEAHRREYVHHPSLVQHIGKLSSIGNAEHAPAPHFRGEEFDALDLLKELET